MAIILFIIRLLLYNFLLLLLVYAWDGLSMLEDISTKKGWKENVVKNCVRVVVLLFAECFIIMHSYYICFEEADEQRFYQEERIDEQARYNDSKEPGW